MDILREVMRFTVASCVIADALVLAIFSVWFVLKFVVHLRDYLARTLFGSPW